MNLPLIRDSALSLRVFGASSLSKPIHSISDFNNPYKNVASVQRAVCLTFDDGPDPAYTPAILNLLAVHNAKATFFVTGEAAKKFPHILEKMARGGHTIGNHTLSHRHPWVISSSLARQEVAATSGIIKDITGAAPRWFRPPFGRLRTAMRAQADAENMATVLWSRSAIDWGPLASPSGISGRLEQVSEGDIVLMHDGKREHNRPDVIIECLPKFLLSLSEKNLYPVGLDDFTTEA